MKHILRNLIVIIGLFFMLPQMVGAQEESSLMTIIEDTAARELPDISAEEVFTLEKGSSVIVGKKEGEWYAVMKDGKMAYIEVSKVKIAEPDDKLVEELNELADETEKDINAVNRYRKEAARAKVWGVVVAVLVVAIFAAGIYSTVKNKSP